MRRPLPPFPQGRPTSFRATVHGTVFAGRDRHLDVMNAGDRLLLIPDPPGQDPPEVWVHLASGEPVGHLPPEISSWLCPWLQEGGGASARALKIHGADVPSWRRLLLEVSCGVLVRGGVQS
ncbi:MAG: hypothetical protein KY453_03860 [Gemmatimonadetes bacterium]|nr:hypothetical protein [Gemmatimonadota bacterium]